MSVLVLKTIEKPRLSALLDRFGEIENPRDSWRVAHPLGRREAVFWGATFSEGAPDAQRAP
jgi:hypothetical protein